MEKGDGRQFQHEARSEEHGWNVVELESRKNLRATIHEFIYLTNHSSLTTGEIEQRLQDCAARFGHLFAVQLVHSLQRDEQDERAAIVWLLTRLNDPLTIPLLQRMAHNEQLARPIRLSAALALAGMGQLPQRNELSRRRLYAMS